MLQINENGYLPSGCVDIFPCAKGGRNDKLLFEKNVSNIANQIIDTDAFVITEDASIFEYSASSLKLKQGENFSFSISGRYIEIGSEEEAIVLANDSSGTFDLYAQIKISATGEINGQDSEVEEGTSVFDGLAFTTNEPSINDSTSDKTIFTLKLLHVESGIASVPSESLKKFSAAKLNASIKRIDGRWNA